MFRLRSVCVLLATVVLVTAVGLLVSTPVTPVLAGEGNGDNPRVMPPQSHPFGKTYGEWGAAWWQWAMSFPYGQDPITDQTGQYNMQKQSGKVWFLAGDGNDPVERTVTIPKDKAVFFAIINVLNDYPCPDPNFQPPPGQTLEEFLTEGADYLISHVTELAVELDGVPLNNLFNYRGTSKLFTFTADPSWVASDPCITGTPQDGVADGYWIMLKPLTAGKHTLHFRGKWVFTMEQDGWDGVFEPETTYHITVTR